MQIKLHLSLLSFSSESWAHIHTYIHTYIHMACMLSCSHGVVIATAMVFSSTALFLAISRQFSTNQTSDLHDQQILRSCLSSGTLLAFSDHPPGRFIFLNLFCWCRRKKETEEEEEEGEICRGCEGAERERWRVSQERASPENRTGTGD